MLAHTLRRARLTATKLLSHNLYAVIKRHLYTRNTENIETMPKPFAHLCAPFTRQQSRMRAKKQRAKKSGYQLQKSNRICLCFTSREEQSSCDDLRSRFAKLRPPNHTHFTKQSQRGARTGLLCNKPNFAYHFVDTSTTPHMQASCQTRTLIHMAHEKANLYVQQTQGQINIKL